MASKLAFISVLVALVLVGEVAAKRGSTADEFRRFMRGFLERRTEPCVRECQTDCKGSDFNCCNFKDTGKRGRCRLVSTYPRFEYMCIHPDYQYVSVDEVVHDDCGLKAK